MLGVVMEYVLVKICTKCHIDYPATTEYFCREKGGRYGIKAQCKVCYSKREHKEQ